MEDQAMKERIGCRHFCCMSLVVVGIALSECTDKNNFFSGIAMADTAEPEQLEQKFPVAVDPHLLTGGMEEELRGCFDFFWNEWVRDESLPTYGLNAGDYVGLRRHVPLAIESQGFYFRSLFSVSREAGLKGRWVGRESLLHLIHFCNCVTSTVSITTLLILKLVVLGGVARTSKSRICRQQQ